MCYFIFNIQARSTNEVLGEDEIVVVYDDEGAKFEKVTYCSNGSNWLRTFVKQLKNLPMPVRFYLSTTSFTLT